MKGISIIWIGAALCCALAAGDVPRRTARAEEFAPQCKAAYLCDAATGTALYERNENKRLPIASMCKIMTLLLAFEAKDAGELKAEEPVLVSAHAAGMGGSQVFLEKGLEYTAGELLKSIAVCSANDACVAIAEKVAGSEASFVERMNERARQLGAENTLFANCTGLPKEPQYSCAKDVALMLRALISHEEYYPLAGIWLEDFIHPDGRTTSMTNTNKLIRFYEGCDGGKTGFTNEAGFCLAATARRANMRVISVAIGAESSKARFQAVSGLFDHAFSSYESRVLLEAGKAIGEKVAVRGSRVHELEVCAKDDLRLLCKRGEARDLHVDYVLPSSLKAPIESGEKVGYAALWEGGVEIARTDLVALQPAARYRWWEAFRETARNWN